MAQECTGRYQMDAPSRSQGSGTPSGYDPNAAAPPRAVEQQPPGQPPKKPQQQKPYLQLPCWGLSSLRLPDGSLPPHIIDPEASSSYPPEQRLSFGSPILPPPPPSAPVMPPPPVPISDHPPSSSPPPHPHPHPQQRHPQRHQQNQQNQHPQHQLQYPPPLPQPQPGQPQLAGNGSKPDAGSSSDNANVAAAALAAAAPAADNSYLVPNVKHPFPAAIPSASNHIAHIALPLPAMVGPTDDKSPTADRAFKVSKNLSRRTRVGQTIIWDRHKTVEEKLGEVNMLLTKMPQGEEDWVAYAPRSPADVDNLFGRLTLQKFSKAKRGAMTYQELLQEYEELVTQVPLYEKQMFKVISVGLSRIATKLGPLRTKEVFEIMEGTASELRWTRVAVSRIIDACDILATFGLGERAYELSMRRDKLPSTVGRFTREHFALLIALMKLHPEKIYKPLQSLPSGKLRIPSILFELLGGEERVIKEDRVDRPMTIADVAGVLEVPSEQPNTCWLDPSRGKAIPVLRPLRPDDVARVLRAAKLQPETRRLKPSSLQELINWRVLDLTEAMYDR